MVPSWSYRWFIKVWLNFPVSKDFSINFLLLVREPASLCLDEESPFHICPQPLLCPPHGLSSVVRDEDCVWLPLTGMGQFAGCKQNEWCSSGSGTARSVLRYDVWWSRLQGNRRGWCKKPQQVPGTPRALLAQHWQACHVPSVLPLVTANHKSRGGPWLLPEVWTGKEASSSMSPVYSFHDFGFGILISLVLVKEMHPYLITGSPFCDLYFKAFFSLYFPLPFFFLAKIQT